MNNRLMNDQTYLSPYFQYMSNNQCEKIHWAALDILERIGVLIFHDEAVELLHSSQESNTL